MVLLLATVLASTPPMSRSTLQVQVDVNGLINASWYVPAGRERLMTALWHTRDVAFRGERIEVDSLTYALPMVGPWLAAPQTDDLFERGLLVASGVLQSAGLSLAAARFFNAADDGVLESGPMLTFSPIAGGRLGVSVRLTGF